MLPIVHSQHKGDTVETLSTCPKKCSASKTGGKKDLMKKFHFCQNMVTKMSMQDFSWN